VDASDQVCGVSIGCFEHYSTGGKLINNDFFWVIEEGDVASRASNLTKVENLAVLKFGRWCQLINLWSVHVFRGVRAGVLDT
jgi:hypothetical protein